MLNELQNKPLTTLITFGC